MRRERSRGVGEATKLKVLIRTDMILFSHESLSIFNISSLIYHITIMPSLDFSQCHISVLFISYVIDNRRLPDHVINIYPLHCIIKLLLPYPQFSELDFSFSFIMSMYFLKMVIFIYICSDKLKL